MRRKRRPNDTICAASHAPVTWRSADVTVEHIAEFSDAQSVIEGESETLAMRSEANRKNVQPVLRFCHQQGLIGGMMRFGELFADLDLAAPTAGRAISNSKCRGCGADRLGPIRRHARLPCDFTANCCVPCEG